MYVIYHLKHAAASQPPTPPPTTVGLSKLLVNDVAMTVQVGTPAYMCPEMAHGAGDMNEAVDVYSFGCVRLACWLACVCLCALRWLC
jgi:serine/threonine protein kinase